MAEGDLVIVWWTADGEEHQERWPTIDAFLSWAAAEGCEGRYTAYREDEDGDLVVIEKGRL